VRTHEAQAALAALRLFVDANDGIAAAQLARTLHYPEAPDEWLHEALGRERDKPPFDDREFHASIALAREVYPAAGAVAALDTSMEAIELRELCRRWGDSSLRLANLDALRMLGEQYVTACAAQGFGATPAGLVAYLQVLSEDGLDQQAVVTGPDAVVVSTWHRAKGLEWPVVVLYDLEGDRKPVALGVSVVANPKGFDFEAPLAGRSVRFWPTPYRDAHRKAPMHARLDAHPATSEAQGEYARQELRLLYVGWTRAKDKLVLATKCDSLDVPALNRLEDEGRVLLSTPPQSGEVKWAGRAFTAGVREAKPREPEALRPSPDEGPPLRKPKEYPRAAVSPSSLLGKGVAGKPLTIGKRTELAGGPDMANLGMAVHGFFGADREELPPAVRLEIARGLLERWEVAKAMAPEKLVEAGDALRTWAASFAPGAQWLRELPLTHRQADGTQVRGTADLVLEAKNGLHLLDHKSFPGSVEEAVERASTYAGQLGAYVRALEAATGKKVLSCHIHLPVSGVMVPVAVG
jgi:ATP-dependent exoDNAse (exonuclease V) beta subunit